MPRPITDLEALPEEFTGILCDIDDTVTLEGRLVPEALFALHRAREAGLRVVHCRGTAARRAPEGSDGAGPTLRNHDGYVHLVARREACR